MACPYDALSRGLACSWGECVCKPGYTRTAPGSFCLPCEDGRYKDFVDSLSSSTLQCEACPHADMTSTTSLGNGTTGIAAATIPSNVSFCGCAQGFWQAARVLSYSPKSKGMSVEVNGVQFSTDSAPASLNPTRPLCEDCGVYGNAEWCLGGQR